MIRQALDILAPHYCYNCGEVGAVLCPSCNYDISMERSRVCVQCRQPLLGDKCYGCPRLFAGIYMVGPREGALRRIVDATKFESVREAADVQNGLLMAALPRLPEVVVVPIPTIHPHVRRRGFDHTLRMGRRLAKGLDGRCERLLIRRSISVQHGATRAQRLQQAAKAFAVKGSVDASTNYLLVDDVTTTGASLVEAAKCLRAAGARHVYAAVTTYQMRD